MEVHYRGITPDGMVPITGYASLADALAFDAFLTATAATLDPALPLDVRRSMALGMLGGTTGGRPGPRELVLYTHARPGQAMVEVENTRTVVTPEQVREWCQQAGTRVTVRPVLDLAEEMSTGAYRPTPSMKEQAWARFPTCVFVDCERPSRAATSTTATPTRPGRPPPPTSSRSAEDTTGSRPPAAGPTDPSTPTPSNGPHRWDPYRRHID